MAKNNYTFLMGLIAIVTLIGEPSTLWANQETTNPYDDKKVIRKKTMMRDVSRFRNRSDRPQFNKKRKTTVSKSDEKKQLQENNKQREAIRETKLNAILNDKIATKAWLDKVTAKLADNKDAQQDVKKLMHALLPDQVEATATQESTKTSPKETLTHADKKQLCETFVDKYLNGQL